MRPSNHSLIRAINRARLLDQIRQRGPIARCELAELIHLDPKSITNLVNELSDDGLIHPTGQRPQLHMGRPHTLLDLAPDRRSFGIFVTPGLIQGVSINWRGIVQVSADEIIPDSPSAFEVRQATTRLIKKLDTAGTAGGIGMAIQGIVDYHLKTIVCSSNLPLLEGSTINDLIPMGDGKSYYLENSANALAIGEKWFGNGRSTQDLVCIEIGTGVGAGIIIDRKLYRGAGMFAGEIGHVRVAEDGPTCSCGNRGCLESWLSSKRLMAAIAIAGNGTIPSTPSDLNDAQHRLIVEAGYRLGQGLATVANLLNPRLVVLSGPILTFHTIFLPEVERSLTLHALSSCSCKLQISMTTNRNAGTIGAACLPLSDIFEVQDHYTV